jgi:hypothetical protein
MSRDSTFSLQAQRRFAPFFWTRFCGAANEKTYSCRVFLVPAERASAWKLP